MRRLGRIPRLVVLKYSTDFLPARACMKDLKLAAHAYCCFTDDGTVILDLKSDQYVALGHSDAQTLAAVICASDTQQMSDTIAWRGSKVVQELINHGLLTSDAASGKEYQRIALRLTYHTALEQTCDAAPIRLRDLVRFIVAALRVRHALHVRSLEFAVNRLRSRKEVFGIHQEHASHETATSMAVRAWSMRPFFFSANKRCLYDSLVLAEYLSYYSLFPQVVFGVATKPFRAHCWVQNDGVILNSDSEDVTQYTPILVI